MGKRGITIKVDEDFDEFYEELKKKDPKITKKKALIKYLMLKHKEEESEEDTEEVEVEEKKRDEGKEKIIKPEEKIIYDYSELSTKTLEKLIEKGMSEERQKVKELESRINSIEGKLDLILRKLSTPQPPPKKIEEDEEDIEEIEEALEQLVKYVKGIDKKVGEKLEEKLKHYFEDEGGIDIMELLKDMNKTGTLKKIITIFERMQREKMDLARANLVFSFIPVVKDMKDEDVNKVARLLNAMFGGVSEEESGEVV